MKRRIARLLLKMACRLDPPKPVGRMHMDVTAKVVRAEEQLARARRAQAMQARRAPLHPVR
jgi:hypothetical protein